MAKTSKKDTIVETTATPVETPVGTEEAGAAANIVQNVPTEIVPSVDSKTPVARADVLPLDYKKAFEALEEADQQAIIALAESIDVKQLDKVMSYGSNPLKKTFNQCGDFLKSESGSTADQMVIAQVIELSKKAADAHEDFNMVLKEPNFLQKLLLKLSKKKEKDRTKQIQNSAVTNFKLLVELKDSCDSWIKMLQDALGETSEALMSDMETVQLLEKYIIAGKMAQENIGQQLLAIEENYTQTGLQKYSEEYEEVKKGAEIFDMTLANLEKSRVMYALSRGQLSLIGSSNIDTQISINTQVNNSMALLGQQLRNAVLNAKTMEVLKGQKAITALNDELIKDVSSTIGVTAEDARRLMYSGFYNVEAAKQAVTTVISTCNTVKAIATELLPKMKAETAELSALVKELEPVVGNAPKELTEGTNTPKSSPSTTGNGGLKF